MLASRLAVAFALMLPVASAQKSATPVPVAPPSGSVSGHVICSDTQRPARFADVALLRKQDPPPPQWWTAKPKDAVPKEPEMLLSARTRTLLDGSFMVRDVPPGDYYAVATMPGYVLPIAPPREEPNPLHDPNDAMVNFPIVHVVADRTVAAELTIHRGSVISGRVRFDDGSPIVGMSVLATVSEGADPSAQMLSPAFSNISRMDRIARTDDEGRYRITGLPPGKYKVELRIWVDADLRLIGNIQTTRYTDSIRQQQNLTVYAPDSFRKSDAKVVEIKSDEPHLDTDIQVNLSEIHSVSGMAFAAEDHHPLGDATAVLEAGQDFRKNISFQADGSFHFDYVPAGTYKLSIYAVDLKPGVAEPGDPGDVQRRYETLRVPVIVADHDVRVDDMTLTEAKPRKSDGN